MQDVCGDIARRHSSDPLMAVNAGLAVIGAALDSQIRIQVKGNDTTFTQPSDTWNVTLAASG